MYIIRFSKWLPAETSTIFKLSFPFTDWILTGFDGWLSLTGLKSFRVIGLWVFCPHLLHWEWINFYPHLVIILLSTVILETFYQRITSTEVYRSPQWQILVMSVNHIDTLLITVGGHPLKHHVRIKMLKSQYISWHNWPSLSPAPFRTVLQSQFNLGQNVPSTGSWKLASGLGLDLCLWNWTVPSFDSRSLFPGYTEEWTTAD